jgi:hypothetical protein
VNTFITDVIADDDFREVCIKSEVELIEVQV